MEKNKEVKIYETRYYCDGCGKDLENPLYKDKKNDLYVYICENCKLQHNLKEKYPRVYYV